MINAIQKLDTAGKVVGLYIQADDESQEEILDALSVSYQNAECLVAEGLHEKYEFVSPEDVGALTDAPLLYSCDDTWLGDHGREFVKNPTVYFFPAYMVSCPWQKLADNGEVYFPAA